MQKKIGLALGSGDIIIQPKLAQYSSWKECFTKNVEREIVELGAKETEKIIPLLKDKLV